MELVTNKALDTYSNSFHMEILASAYATLGPEWQGQQVFASFSRLYFIESGAGWLRCNGKTIPLVPGKVYWVPQNLSVDFGCGQSLTKLYFHIQLLKPDRYDFLQAAREIAVADIPDGWLSELLRLQNSRNVLDSLERRQYLLKTLHLLAAQLGVREARITEYSEKIGRCIDYVHKHLHANLRVTDLAQLCFVSARYLTEQFRKELGVTPGQYIDDQLILAAQRRLSDSADSVGKISEELGFSDPFYFCRKFKHKCGMTPLQYRKKNRI